MAKILISAPAGIFDHNEYKFAIFYEGFIKGLIVAGHHVQAINTFNFLNNAWHGNNQVNFTISQEKLSREIANFDPDLIITFNNSIPECILEITECPVAVWDADSLPFFNDKDYIKTHIDRYTFLCFSSAGVSNALRFGATKDKVHLVLAGTAIEAEVLLQDKNISFIGTMFTAPKTFVDLLKKFGPNKIRPLVEDLKKDFYADHDEILKSHQALWIKEHIDVETLASISSTQKRNTLLNDLQELGLSIYGDSGWYDTGQYLPWLAMSYNSQKIYSLKHNQDVYNSSKICINISHAHTVDGFPWRVMDIMASNGCLVSDKKSGLADFTKGYVDIPMYETRHEAYDLCQRLLRDDIWRRDIVLGSQACIKAKGSWRERISEIEQIFNLTICAEKPDTDYNSAILNTDNLIRPFSKKILWLVKSIIFLTPDILIIKIHKLLTKLDYSPARKLIRIFKLAQRIA